MKKLTWFLLLYLLAGSLVPGAQAQEPNPPLPPPVRPIVPPPIINGQVRIPYQRVEVSIVDQVATTHIDQLFANENDWMLEGTYLFPLPPEASVSQLTMWIDGRPIEAKILGQEEARGIYDNIVRQLRDPALLEYVGSSAIQANVFPIPPHGERRIEIEYAQVLPAENGLVHYVYPQSTKLYTTAPLDNQSIRVEVQSNEAIRAIYSPSHPVAIDREGEYRATAGFEDSQVVPERDFELYYSVAPEAIGLNLLSYKEAGEDGFFLLLVAPSITVDPSQVIARDVVVVVDTSGSMEGAKMAQAREAARFVVEHLNAEDRFNIIAFSTGVRRFMPALTPASAAAEAGSFLDSLEALGGTNISQALLEAGQQADPARPLNIIFLTDGLATEGIVDTPLLLQAVAQAAPSSTRLFAFGVGDDVDTLLLDSLAEAHRGSTTYVRPYQAIDEAVSAFYARVSTPVLADISLDYGGMTVDQVYPERLPDLFAGTQLILTGRYREGGPATITLRGTVNGQEQRFQYADNLFRTNGGDASIPRLWATRAIGHLLNEIRLHGENGELVQSVVNLSIRYGIITPYTSYLIQEDDIFSQSGRQTVIEEAAASFEAPAPVTGQKAVDAAATAGQLAEAEAALPAPSATLLPPAEGAPAATTFDVRYVGSKTFVLRDGQWVDTAFEADRQTAQQVGFASDSYFELLRAAPELGPYLALGDRVLLVYAGQAYQIVPGEGQATIALPAVSSGERGVETGATPAGNTAAPATQAANGQVPAALPATSAASSAPPAITLWLGGLAVALALFLLIARLRAGGHRA